ncbi:MULTISPECIES: hypothetical protein [Lactobacillus]|uniref:Uncharacterized protein n=1 Tax=Lactobacillus xujianguonis TaxID=2495899 RepID=A0A437SX11_9LACO|nr:MULTISPECIES: hypothetical protein [Lactobacillus]RVU71478.1 hypothetical protein EJK17_01895 [Lactobacillus xujianguonis]RVU73701.1 hypothetical protein EJK20_06945 [Lactobacillus xujianguonis]
MKKTELFYQIEDFWHYQDTDTWENAFVKATRTRYAFGPKLRVANTYKQAKQESQVETLSNKMKLQQALDQAKLGDNRDFYQSRYNWYIEKAKSVLNNKQATIAEVNLALSNLNEAKVKNNEPS